MVENNGINKAIFAKEKFSLLKFYYNIFIFTKNIAMILNF
jgi:hypothetical protein